MKVLVAFACTLAVAFGWGHQSGGYHGPQHVPVIHNGVPIETPEVQHAKAAHLAALAEASQHAGYEHDFVGREQSYDHYGGEEYNNYGHGGFKHHVQIPAYETSHVKPQIGHDGKPLDTPEVETAKAHHFAAVHEALSRAAASHSSHGVHYRKRRGIESYDFGHYEVPQVHYSALDFGHGGHELSYDAIPIADYHHGQTVSTQSNDHGYTVHQEHAQHYSHGYYTHEQPQIGHDGKPLDTAEVEHAKLAHLAAHYQAKIRNALAKQGVVSHEGPMETPEVQHAKALHFAAHAAAKAHPHHY